MNIDISEFDRLFRREEKELERFEPHTNDWYITLGRVDLLRKVKSMFFEEEVIVEIEVKDKKLRKNKYAEGADDGAE